ncbi:phosphoribosylanthranilate isomerase [Arhodomonas sp. AD133]|uniref:phosphoribosylanthranilate isomerase n=1 Tax=Arhodomonas sp. AD133 TaxID=3415009 RepID=UPI003EB83191
MFDAQPVRTRVKVCCIASAEEAWTAIATGADALGLVGAMPSGPGTIDDATIASVAAQVPPPVASFLLTAETTAEGIAEHVRRTGASTVQIVNHIDPAQTRALVRALPSTRRVQVIHVEDESALGLIDRYADSVHAFLLDSGRPTLTVPELGGTGRVHDWRVSAEFVRHSPLPVFLAGGLTPGNVDEAIETVRPYGLDLCSGVRTDGRLDPDKLSGFMTAVREADRLVSTASHA